MQKPTAVVTGGTKGIGKGITRMLVDRGYHVIVSYAHDENAAEEAKREFGDQVTLVKANQALRSETYQLVEAIKGITDNVSCIVCNAGITIRKGFTETSDEEWDAMMEVGLNSHVILLRELYPLIVPNSRIIFTGSTLGIHPHATVLGYGVAKEAVHALAKNLVKFFEPMQTTVNVVAPGFVETEWQKNKPLEIRQNICRKTAIHRFASIDETVNAYAFCLDNGYVNGSVIEINGGYAYM